MCFVLFFSPSNSDTLPSDSGFLQGLGHIQEEEFMNITLNSCLFLKRFYAFTRICVYAFKNRRYTKEWKNKTNTSTQCLLPATWLKKYNGLSTLKELVGLSLILFSSLPLEVTTTMIFVLILSLVFVVLYYICIPKKSLVLHVFDMYLVEIVLDILPCFSRHWDSSMLTYSCWCIWL